MAAICIGIDTMVVARAEEHHQGIVGMDGPVRQVLEDAAVVTAHDVAGPAFGGDFGRDLHTLARERRPGAVGPGVRTPAAFIGAGGVGIPDHRDVVDRGAAGHRLVRLQRGACGG